MRRTVIAESPREVRFTVRHAETGRPLLDTVLRCQVELHLELGTKTSRGLPFEHTVTWNVDLPPIRTDHVGYAALPLDTIRSLGRHLQAARHHAVMAGMPIDVFRVSVTGVFIRETSSPGMLHVVMPPLEPLASRAISEPIPAPAPGEPGVGNLDEPPDLGTLLETVMGSETGRTRLASILTELTRAAAAVEETRIDAKRNMR